jgi:hypothetical protein
MSNAETIGEGDVDRAISSTKSWAGASMER